MCPTEATPVIIRLLQGDGNLISTNHMVALDVHAKSAGSDYAAQVDALLTTDGSDALAVTTVLIEPA